MRRAILIAALCLLLGAQTAQAQERSLEDLDRIAPCERTVHRYSSWEELPDSTWSEAKRLGYAIVDERSSTRLRRTELEVSSCITANY